MKTVDNKSLPVVIAQFLNDKLEITAGFFRLNDDKTFTGSLTLISIEDGVISTEVDEIAGSYTVTGSSIEMSYGDGTTDTGSVGNSTLTLNSEGSEFVFKR